MNQKKKIALVANTSWSIYNFRLEVSRSLRDQGYEIFIIAPRDKHSEKLIAEGFTFIKAPIKSYSKSLMDDLRFLFFLWRVYRRQQFHHIFHYTIKPNIYGSVAAWGNDIECTAVVTGLGRLLNMKTGWKKSIVYNLYRLGTLCTTHLWFLNKEDKMLFHKLKLAKNTKSNILPSEGINLGFFSSNKEKSHFPVSFLFAGRLLKEKGIEVFIHAASLVNKFYPQSRFDIVGFIDSKDNDSIDPAVLLDYQRKKIIHFHGDTEDIRPFIENASCVVLPSFYGEGVSRILLEAASMKTPIITSSNRGCADVVIDGFNGFLCKSSAQSDLADQIMAFISLDTEAKKAMGENGYSLVKEKFSVEKVIRFYNEHLGIGEHSLPKIKA